MLTPAESKVIASLLGAGTEPEEERIRSSRIPRSTYQLVKRRLFSEAVLEDRYVPEPQLLGYGSLSLAIARPTADLLPEVARRWSTHPSATVVWRGLQSVLGVFLHPDGVYSRALRSELVGDDLGIRSPFVTCDLTTPSVPVYFDFEGCWRNLSGAGRSVAYPRSLGALSAQEVERGRVRPQVRRGIRSLLLSQSAAGALPEVGPPHRQGPATLPKSLRILVERGWVHWRVFPNLHRTLDVSGRRTDEILLVHGALRQEGGSLDLFKDLLQQSRAYPFLYLTDEHTVILGGLGARSHRPGSARLPQPRRSVMGVLRNHLVGVDVVRERLPHVHVIVDHQYSKLVDAFPEAPLDGGASTGAPRR